MGEDQGTGSATVTEASDPEQIQREIEATREELGDTVEALAEKPDVKAHAKRSVEETKTSVAEKKEELLGKAKQASPDGAVCAAGEVSHKARKTRFQSPRRERSWPASWAVESAAGKQKRNTLVRDRERTLGSHLGTAGGADADGAEDRIVVGGA